LLVNDWPVVYPSTVVYERSHGGDNRSVRSAETCLLLFWGPGENLLSLRDSSGTIVRTSVGGGGPPIEQNDLRRREAWEAHYAAVAHPAA
jgi:hypothetical protein